MIALALAALLGTLPCASGQVPEPSAHSTANQKQSMKWSEQLVKNRIDPSLFEATPEQSQGDRKAIADLKFYCEGVFNTSEKVLRVRKKIEEVKTASRAPAVLNVADEVLEELDEIADDFKFAKSRRGKFVLFANNYTQEVYKKLRANADFNDLYIASHPDREELVLTGSAKRFDVLIASLSLISQYPSGVPFRVDVNIK